MRPAEFAAYLHQNKVEGEDLVKALKIRDVSLMEATSKVCIDILIELGHHHAASSLSKRVKELFEEKAHGIGQ